MQASIVDERIGQATAIHVVPDRVLARPATCRAACRLPLAVHVDGMPTGAFVIIEALDKAAAARLWVKLDGLHHLDLGAIRHTKTPTHVPDRSFGSTWQAGPACRIAKTADGLSVLNPNGANALGVGGVPDAERTRRVAAWALA